MHIDRLPVNISATINYIIIIMYITSHLVSIDNRRTSSCIIHELFPDPIQWLLRLLLRKAHSESISIKQITMLPCMHSTLLLYWQGLYSLDSKLTPHSTCQGDALLMGKTQNGEVSC